jgi:hypothetical protein
LEEYRLAGLVAAMLGELGSIVTFTMNKAGGAFIDWQDVERKLKWEVLWACRQLKDPSLIDGIRMTENHVAFIKAHPEDMAVSLALVNALRSIRMSPFEFDVVRFYNTQPYESWIMMPKTASLRAIMTRYLEVKRINENNALALKNAAEVLRNYRNSVGW